MNCNLKHKHVCVVLTILVVLSLISAIAATGLEASIKYGDNVTAVDSYVQCTVAYTSPYTAASYVYTEVYSFTDSSLPITIITKP